MSTSSPARSYLGPRPDFLTHAARPGRHADSPHSERGVRFITISRQIGASFPALPKRLATALSAAPPGEARRPWSAWDRELIEKVSADYRLPVQAIERVEEEGYSWVDTFVSGLGGMHDEVAIVHRLRDSVRALAEQGNVVLVGHGCVFMTRDLPGGLHIRIVAPLRRRIENLARLMNVSTDEATGRLRQSQRKWDRFLRRFWPLQSMKPETFAATLNSAVLSEDQVLHCVASLVK